MINNRYRYARRILRNIERSVPYSRCKYRSCRRSVRRYTLFILAITLINRELPGYDKDIENQRIRDIKEAYRSFYRGDMLTVETMTRLCEIVNK